jgi:hypothetical protein
MWKTALKVLGWIVTTGIALAGLVVALEVEASTKTLSNAQTQQIKQLERATPTGTIVKLIPYHPLPGHAAPVTDVRHDPVLTQQVYNVYGTASNIPDNGGLFMVIHFYGERLTPFNREAPQFFLVPALPGFDQRWKAAGIYIGTKSPPKAESYRLSLYFCNSVDSEKIFAAIKKSRVKNYGLPYLSYPSCKQLDSIFVRRART